jgi:NIMA (never in mitosis gene a)-related kinase
MEEAEIWRMAMQMLHGLKTLHRMNIFHRDIKSANLLLTSNNTEVKLGDLNVSKISKSGMASTQTGTPYYASPEVWQDMPYNAKCDIWSMGCVLYEMCTFRPPFTANDLNGLKKKIIAGHYDRIP